MTNGQTGMAVATGASITRTIEQEILSGRIPSGSKLPSERQLAASYGVGRPLVREALRELSAAGLIEVFPGRGAFARGARAMSAARPLDSLYRRQRVTPREVVEARMMVERDAAYLAAQRATTRDLGALRYALERFDASAGLVVRARWDVAFHTLITHASGNLVIETMFSSIATLVFDLVVRSLGDPTVSREGIPYHREILGAIEAREPERARAGAEGHIGLASSLYGNDLDRSLDAIARRELARQAGSTASPEHLFDLRMLEAAVDEALAQAEGPA